MAWRLVFTELKFTAISLPPRSRFSSWRGWWMSPMNYDERLVSINFDVVKPVRP